MRLGTVLLCLLAWPATGFCGSPVPTELYAEVDHALRPAMVLADPEGYRGRTLLLGGIVTRTVSEAASVSVAVDVYRLDDNDRPLDPEPALGGIVASGTDLNGAQLQPGRLVTLVGRVAGRRDAGGRWLPHLEVCFIHAWPTVEEEAAAQQKAYPYGCCYDPWWGPSWSDPWCAPWYYGPYPRWHFGGGLYHSWH